MVVGALIAGCASAPDAVPPLNGLAVFESYVDRSVVYSWEQGSERGSVLVSGSLTGEGRLRLTATAADERSEVEREPYESTDRTVSGFFGRTTGVAHLIFALHLPDVVQPDASWSADRIYGPNTASYRLVGASSMDLSDGTGTRAYRIEMEIASERDDLRGEGFYLVSPDEGVLELVYTFANGETLSVRRAGNEPEPGGVTLQVVPDSGYDSGYAFLLEFIPPAPILENAILTIRPYLDGEEMTGIGTSYRPGEHVYDAPFQIARFGTPLTEDEFGDSHLAVVIHLEVDENRHPDDGEPAWVIERVTYRELRLGAVPALPLTGRFRPTGPGGQINRGGSDRRRQPLPGEPRSLYEVAPRGSDVPVDADIHVALRARVERDSVLRSFSIDPPVESEIYLRPFTSPEDTIITIELGDLQPDTDYRCRFGPGLFIDGSPTDEPWEIEFRTGAHRSFPPPSLAGRPVIVAPDHLPGTLSFRLEWEPIDEAASYEVQEAQGTAFSEVSRGFTATGTALDITVERQNEYYYRVRGLDGTGSASDWSRIHFVGAGE